MGKVYVERNGRRYAYEASSRRVPGKANPVTTMTYLGPVDPDTGEISHKTPRGGSVSVPLADGNFETRSLGDALIAWNTALDLGLDEDLETAFPGNANVILAMALAQVIRPGSVDDYVLTLRSSCIPEIVGVERKGLRESVDESLRSIDLTSEQNLFDLRAERSGGETLLCIRDFRVFSGSPTESGMLRSGNPWSTGDANVYVSADVWGIPVAFRFHSESSREFGGFARSMARFERSAGCTVVSDSYLQSPVCVLGLMRNRQDFAIACDPGTEIFRKLMENHLGGSGKPVEHRTEATRLEAEHALGIVSTDRGWEYVTDDDPRFERCTVKIKAFVGRNEHLRRWETTAINSVVRGTKEMLEGISDDDISLDALGIGRFIELMDLTRDGDGRIHVNARSDIVTHAKRRAGGFVILTSLDSFDDAIEAFTRRAGLFQDLAGLMGELDGRMMSSSSSKRLFGHLFVSFLAGIILAGMRVRLEGTGESVDDALRKAGQLTAVRCGDRLFLSNIGVRTASVLSLFGVDDLNRIRRRLNGERP